MKVMGYLVLCGTLCACGGSRFDKGFDGRGDGRLGAPDAGQGVESGFGDGGVVLDSGPPADASGDVSTPPEASSTGGVGGAGGQDGRKSVV